MVGYLVRATRGILGTYNSYHALRAFSLSKSKHASSNAASTGMPSSGDIELSYVSYPDKNEKEDTNKRPVVFLHGMFGSKGNFHSVCKHMSADGRKIIAFDARNHGESEHADEMDVTCMKDDLKDLIDDLKLDRPVILGHSMGGKTAMTLALSNPDHLSALVVADVCPDRSPGGEIIKAYIMAMLKLKIPRGTSIVQARRMATAQLSSDITDRGILQFLLTNLKQFPDGEIKWRTNLEAILKNHNSLMDFPNLLKEKTFMKKTLFVFGSNSAHYRSCSQEQILKFFPNAKITIIPDAGHFVHADKPLEFVSIVNEFLKNVDKSS